MPAPPPRWAQGEVVRVLLAHGCDVNLQHAAKATAGHTALMMAAELGHLAVVRQLLAHNAAVAPRDQEGHTALDLAVRHGHSRVAAVLQVASLRDTRTFVGREGGK